VHDPRSRELYSSPNGDRWLLAREPEAGRVFVRHIPNVPSGGKITDIEIGAFLCERNYGPQHIELLRLIGTLVENGVPIPGVRKLNYPIPCDRSC
jgi:MerR HTH family regulatory protein